MNGISKLIREKFLLDQYFNYSANKPGIQRAAADAITEIVYERCVVCMKLSQTFLYPNSCLYRPIDEIKGYQEDYILARNECIRQGSRQGLVLRQPLLSAGAVQAITKMLEDGMNANKVATVQSAAMVRVTHCFPCILWVSFVYLYVMCVNSRSCLCFWWKLGADNAYH